MKILILSFLHLFKAKKEFEINATIKNNKNKFMFVFYSDYSSEIFDKDLINSGPFKEVRMLNNKNFFVNYNLILRRLKYEE